MTGLDQETPEINNPTKRSNITIILVRPRYPENIGSAARAMMNMGFADLVLVNPEDPDQERMRKTATHQAATTTRKGKKRFGVISPQAFVNRTQKLGEEDKIAILFGSEDKGLTNDELKFADCLVTIPTVDFSSINLAQSVMILCYELSRRPATTSSTLRQANKKELAKVYDELENLLVAIDLHNPENPDHWPARFRNLLSRAGLRAGDAALVRDFVRKAMQKLAG